VAAHWRHGGKALTGLVLLAAVLSGCTPSPPSGAGAPAAEAGPATDHTPEELHQALEHLAEGTEDAVILDDEELRQTIPAAQAWLEGVEVTPAECGPTLTVPLNDQLASATMAALRIGQGIIAVAAFRDTATLQEQLAKDEQLSDRCTRYTVLHDRRRVAYHLAQQQVHNEAEYSRAHLLTSSDGSEAAQQIVVRAAQDNVMVTISQPLDKATTAEQLASAAQQADDLLKLLGE